MEPERKICAVCGHLHRVGRSGENQKDWVIYDARCDLCGCVASGGAYDGRWRTWA